MEAVLIVRYTEIILKGKNRGFFEKKLVENVKKTLNNYQITFLAVKRLKGRVFVYFETKEAAEKAIEFLSCVFGVQSLGLGLMVKNNVEEIKGCVFSQLEGVDFGTFRISTKRADKSFPMKSTEVDREIGAAVVNRFGKDVDLNNYDINVKIEIFGGMAAVSVVNFFGPGGLPLGTSGKVFVGCDYENHGLAAFLMMRRGCKVAFYGKSNPDSEEAGSLSIYNNGRPVDFMGDEGDGSDLLGTMELHHISAFVLGISGEKLVEIWERLPNCLVLTPLAGLDGKELGQLSIKNIPWSLRKW